MSEIKDFLKTFDPKEVEQVIESLKESGFHGLRGEVGLRLDRNFAILQVRSAQLQLKGENETDQPSGFFFLFSRNDLADLVKTAFDLRERSE